MSLSIDTKTPNKKEISSLLRAIACWIEVSGNKTVTIQLSLIFNVEKEGKDC